MRPLHLMFTNFHRVGSGSGSKLNCAARVGSGWVRWSRVRAGFGLQFWARADLHHSSLRGVASGDYWQRNKRMPEIAFPLIWVLTRYYRNAQYMRAPQNNVAARMSVFFRVEAGLSPWSHTMTVSSDGQTWPFQATFLQRFDKEIWRW